MKTLIIKLLTLLATAALFATGCVSEEPPYKPGPGTNPPGENTGYLVIGTSALQVLYDNDTQPDEAQETRANPDVDDFIVKALNSAGEAVWEKTYAELKTLSEPIEMAVGAYTLQVRSEQSIQAVDWEHPYYAAEETFTVEKAKTTTIDEIVCTLQNIKVTVSFPDDLAAMLSESTISTVSLGDQSIVFAKGEARAAYFKPLQEENTLDFVLTGTYEDTGDPVNLSRSIEKVKAGQWRKITVKIASATLGSVRFSIEVDNFMQDSNIPVNGTDGLWEEVIGENEDVPTIVWPGHDLSQPYTLTDEMFDADGNYIGSLALDIETPNAIESLVVSISSSSSAFMASMASIQIPETFDLCTLSPSSPAGIILKGFGYPLGDEVRGRTSRSFDIAGQMSMLYAFEGTHVFSFTVADINGRTTTAALTLVVESKGTQQGPTIVWLGYDIDRQYEIVEGMEVDVDITAEAGIKSFWVTIESDNQMFIEDVPSIGIPLKFDLGNIVEEDLIEIFREEFRFPVNEQVIDQTYLRFNITEFVELLGLFGAGEYNFVLDVTDNNNITTSKTLQLFIKEDE